MDWIQSEQQSMSEERDVNSLQNIFYSIVSQISGNSEYEIPFLHLLQHLLKIEYKDNELPALIWDSTESLVESAVTSIKCKEDAKKLFRLLKGSADMLSNGLTLNSNQTNLDELQKSGPPTPPPPPPPPSSSIPLTLVSPPPPPPPMPSSLSSVPIAPPLPPLLGQCNTDGLLSCPPLSSQPVMRTKNLCENHKNETIFVRKLPQQEIPKPKTKMKSINWSKIPSEKIVSSAKPNLWSIVADQHRSDFQNNVDFSELEDLFCQPSNSSAPNSCPGSPRLPRRPVSSEIVGSPFNSLERKAIKRQSGEYQQPIELQLLDGKKSLNVNIFLKQYRGSIEELIHRISVGDHKELGAERLKNVLKILPEPNEIELLEKNEEEIQRMPTAEKFLLNLIRIPNYKLKIEEMLLREEFESNVQYLEPAIDSVRNAAKEIKESKTLHEILYLILVSGNFLNSGGYAGDAAGFKMMALLKLPEIRANKPGINLIHYVAMQSQKKGLQNFAQELPSLEEASKISIENLRIEVNSLSTKIQRLKEQIEKQRDDKSVQKEIQTFLNCSEKQIKKLSVVIETQLNAIREEMAEFLCEDLERFKLEECFRIFSSFCQRFKLAIDENERRRENEIKLEARKSNSHLKRWTNSCESDNFLIDNNITPTNSSNSLTNSLTNSLNLDQKLKRRSRRGSQEDELHVGLMEFLKTANDLGGNDIPLFGGTFRRMGSGRRSRSSNPISESELNSRDRTLNDSKNKDKIDEIDVLKKNDFNKRIKVSLNTEMDNKNNKRNVDLSDGDSDDESNKKKPFDRFSPLRKTLSYKSSELESKLTKRLNKLERNENLVKSDGNNNVIEVQDIKHENNERIKTEERPKSPTHLRQFWGSKELHRNDLSCNISRPSTLHLSNHYNTQQPTAVITPTKQVRNEDNCHSTPLLSPVLTLETERLNRTGCLPRRMSITSPSNATAAAIVTPIQINEKTVEKPVSIAPLKSRLPVRKSPLTPIPQMRQNGNNCQIVPPKTGIPTPSKVSVSRNTSLRTTNNRTSNQIQNSRTYRSPSTVSRTNLSSDVGALSSMKRSSQLLPQNRSFMKQTSSSAAKTRNQSRY